MIPAEQLTSERLLLRRPQSGDADAVYRYCSDPEVTRWLNWPACRDPEQFRHDFSSYGSKWCSGEEFYWVITLSGSHCVIGSIACRMQHEVADLGFLLERQCWGYGLATEAAALVLKEVSSAPQVERVVAVCAADNVGSARVLEKIGMQCKGLVSQFLDCPNISSEKRDALVFDHTRAP